MYTVHLLTRHGYSFAFGFECIPVHLQSFARKCHRSGTHDLAIRAHTDTSVMIALYFNYIIITKYKFHAAWPWSNIST